MSPNITPGIPRALPNTKIIGSNPQGSDANLTRSILEVDDKYVAVKFAYSKNVALNVSNPQRSTQEINVQGDTIFVARLDQHHAVYIKLDSPRNAWIRIIAGDTITRRFKKFWIRVADSVSLIPTPQNRRQIYGVLYVSNGPLLVRRQRKIGIGAGALCISNIPITSTPASLISLIQPGPYTTGAVGGTVLFTNTGGNTIYIDLMGENTTVPSAIVANQFWYPIAAGATLTLDLDVALMTVSHDTIPMLSCAAGQSSNLALIISPESDFGVEDNAFLAAFADNFIIE